MIIFSVYDKKAEYFMQPMFSRNAAQMIRDLSDVVADSSSVLSKHPHDFALYQLGFFDADSGAIHDVDKIKIGNISEIFGVRDQLHSEDAGNVNV